MALTADVLCTVRLSRRLYPDAVGHGLDALFARHGLADPLDAVDPAARTGRHSALGDARALWRFVNVIAREKPPEEIAAAVKRLLKIPSLPPQLGADALEGVPDCPGVYRFFGVNDLPLYIGKSVNLRDRVRSHFTSDYRNSNDHRLSAEIRRLDWIETAGELGALLLESRLVKEVAPLHNALLRRRRTNCVVRLPSLREAPEIARIDEIDWDARGPEAEPLYGPFASPRAARDCLRTRRARRLPERGAVAGPGPTAPRRTYGNPVTLRNLDTGTDEVIADVVAYQFDDSAKVLAWTVASRTDSTKDGVYIRNLVAGTTQAVLPGPGNYRALAFDRTQQQFVFASDRDEFGKPEARQVIYLGSVKSGTALPVVRADMLPEGMRCPDNLNVSFSRSGTALQLALAPPPEDTVPVDSLVGKARYDLWHWKDPALQPTQLLQVKVLPPPPIAPHGRSSPSRQNRAALCGSTFRATVRPGQAPVPGSPVYLAMALAADRRLFGHERNYLKNWRARDDLNVQPPDP